MLFIQSYESEFFSNSFLTLNYKSSNVYFLKTKTIDIKNSKFANFNIVICEFAVKIIKNYPTKLITFPGTMIILFGVFPSNCFMVRSSAITIS